MSIKNYRFVSPGVFVNEIDNSQLPASPAGIGPVVIGRAEKGPGLRPVTVNSFSEFVNVFGAPIPGNANGDVWRLGANVSAPTYGAYAAQAYLRNSAPLTFVRLLGNQVAGATGGGQAGWDGGDDGKAWGLVVFEPLTALDSNTIGTGSFESTLAAIFYTTKASTYIQLSGNVATTDGPTPSGSGVFLTGSDIVVKDTGVPYEFNMIINNATGAGASKTTTFNFTLNDSKYLRTVFNTTPQRTNQSIVAASAGDNYWLGESFDRHMKASIPSSGDTFAAIVRLVSGSNEGDDFRTKVQSAQTPAIIGCDTLQRAEGSNAYSVEAMPTLFTVHALNQAGDWTNRNLKVSIQDIKVSTNESNAYGSFSVVVRKLDDTDNVVRIVEQFNDCNLNPESLSYIARKIGDKSTSWNSDERRYVQVGDYDNVSQYIRVAVNEDLVGENAGLLPFGFKGILKYADDATLGDGEVAAAGYDGNWVSGSTTNDNARPNTGTFAFGDAAGASGWALNGPFIVSGACRAAAGPAGVRSVALTCSVLYPAPEFRVNATDGNLNNPTDAYFGLQTTRTAGGTTYDASTIDLLRPRGGMVSDMFASPYTNYRERSMYFTLDDISGSGVWVSGSHAAGTALVNVSGAISGVLDKGYDRFTVPMYGGFDGLDITEFEPFRNSQWSTGTPSSANSYTFNSILQSIDSISDPEVVEMNLASIPGLKQSGLTTHLLNVCEDRADSLAIMDIEGGFAPRAESTSVSRNNTANEVSSVINSMRTRGLNSSYGCCFFPWVRGRDTINGALLWLPPSIAALGTFSSSQKKTQVWFAPAGFNRGGLTEGSAGIPIVDVSHQLRRKDRDDLYAANINPIAKFPNEGVVVFGQKTLQVTPSALDRINVRRLMIFVKKRISQVASRLLFDPNVQTTWNRFISAVQPILADIKTNFGLSDYKLVLDESTTTPDLVDRNIMYAKIFLKPTRAIEFIAIDFNITRTGASFDD